MKSIELKVVPLDKGELNYKGELTALLRSPVDPQRGADIEEMRHNIRILDALEKVEDDVLKLEDADFSYLQGRMKKARFGMVHPAIVQFIDDITEPKEAPKQ